MTKNDNLPIAASIAALATEAAETGMPLDVDVEARRLVKNHPEAEASAAVVKAALIEEERAAKDEE